MTPDEQAEFDRQERERETLSHRWLTAREEQLIAGADPVLREAFEIAGHDALLISAKLDRALSGRDRLCDDEHDHPIQNDWNGSAKVALISLERSEAAWRTIAAATTDSTPMTFADQLRDLRREVEDTFPHAWAAMPICRLPDFLFSARRAAQSPRMSTTPWKAWTAGDRANTAGLRGLVEVVPPDALRRVSSPAHQRVAPTSSSSFVSRDASSPTSVSPAPSTR
jgi:hypothetical protein